MSIKTEKTIGFLGLGTMGFPMCYGLSKAGFRMILPAYRRSVDQAAGYSPLAKDETEKTALIDEMLKNGAVAATSQKELLEQVDIVMISMPTSRQVEALVLAADGILANLRPGGIVIDLTSADASSTRKLSAMLLEKGIEMLDAPISGGNVGATNQTLSVMIGGKKEVFQTCREIFDTIGDPQKVTYVGPSGAGDIIKSANNYLSSMCLIASTEAIAVAAKAGIDPHVAARVISQSGGCSQAVTYKYPELVFPGKNMGMSVNLMLKDIRLFKEAACGMDVPAFLASQLYEVFHLPVAEDKGNVDFVYLVEMYEKWSGVKLRGIDGEA